MTDVERHRLFVAVGVPAAVAQQVADAVEPVRSHAPTARWTDASSWHLTLAFLGSVPVTRREAIDEALAEVASRHRVLELGLTGRAGMFGRRVLWAELQPAVPLQDLAVDIGAALEPLGYPPDDRPFHPHLTLARARRDNALPKNLDERYSGPQATWRVRTVDLMRSHLGRQGSRYERVGSWPLGDP